MVMANDPILVVSSRPCQSAQTVVTREHAQIYFYYWYDCVGELSRGNLILSHLQLHMWMTTHYLLKWLSLVLLVEQYSSCLGDQNLDDLLYDTPGLKRCQIRK